jgi:hypothetical protein
VTTTEDPWVDAAPLPPEPAPPPAPRSPANGQAPPVDRTPPNDLAAEQAVLGAVILRPDLIHHVGPILGDDDWHLPAHRTLWEAITDLDAAGTPVDEITLWNHLQHDTTFVRAGGALLIHSTVEAVTAPDAATYYAQIVADRAAERRTIALGTKLVQAGHTAADPDLIRGWLEEHLGRQDRTARATTSSWQRVDLTDILANHDDVSPRPTLLARRDGANLLYPGYVHSVSGEPGSGKSWLADLCVVQEIEAGHDIAYLDFEDRAHSFIQRLRDLGATDTAIAAHVRYIRPETALDAASRQHVEAEAQGVTFVVVDGITEAMTMHGLSLMDNEDVARWLELIPRRLADHGGAVLQIDHVVKNTEARGRYAIGGQHKLAGITGVAFKMITVHSFGRGLKGKARLIIDKDRHGHVGPNGGTVAELTLDATDPSGRLFSWLDTAGGDHGEDGEWRPTGYMEKVSRWLEINPGAPRKDIETAVRGRREHIRDAIQVLITEGHIRTEPGPYKAVLHYIETPFREDEQ